MGQKGQWEQSLLERVIGKELSLAKSQLIMGTERHNKRGRVVQSILKTLLLMGMPGDRYTLQLSLLCDSLKRN